MTIIASAVRKMIASGIAKSAPLWSNAVVTDAAIGTLAAVATRNSSRTVRELPGTALADHANCDQGSHSSRKISVDLPTVFQVGS